VVTGSLGSTLSDTWDHRRSAIGASRPCLGSERRAAFRSQRGRPAGAAGIGLHAPIRPFPNVTAEISVGWNVEFPDLSRPYRFRSEEASELQRTSLEHGQYGAVGSPKKSSQAGIRHEIVSFLFAIWNRTSLMSGAGSNADKLPVPADAMFVTP
jgi:hypothetical protein